MKEGREEERVRAVSDYIIALRDLKRGLRNKKMPRSLYCHRKSTVTLAYTQICQITAGLIQTNTMCTKTTQIWLFTTTVSSNRSKYAKSLLEYQPKENI